MKVYIIIHKSPKNLLAKSQWDNCLT